MSDIKILLVDDDPVHLRLITSQLEKLGYKADTATSGKQATGDSSKRSTVCTAGVSATWLHCQSI